MEKGDAEALEDSCRSRLGALGATAPIGSDLEKFKIGLDSVKFVFTGLLVGESSPTLELDEDCVIVRDRGCIGGWKVDVEWDANNGVGELGEGEESAALRGRKVELSTGMRYLFCSTRDPSLSALVFRANGDRSWCRCWMVDLLSEEDRFGMVEK